MKSKSLNYTATAVGFKKDKSTTVTERPNKLLANIIKSNKTRGRQLIDSWIRANNQAGNAENPKRTLLYKLYDELKLDGEVFSEWETRRKLRLIGTDFDMFDANNKPNEEATEALKSLWFTELMSLALDSKLWGHSLIEVNEITAEGLIHSVELVAREHIVPEKGMFTAKQGDDKGTFYREDPTAMQWMFEIGKNNDLGLLNICAPYVLFMRFAMTAWSEFCEIFAMPLRVGKTQSKDVASLNRMNDMLLEMATASYAVIDKDEEIEFVEANKTNGDVYGALMDKMAAKISKVLNGAIVGEGTQSGSLAKDEVAQSIQQLVTGADMAWFEGWMKDQGTPKLIALGYKFEGLKFKFKKPKNIKASLDIMQGLTNAGFVPSEKWVVDEFNVPIEGRIEPTKTKTEDKTKVKAEQSFFD